MPEFTYQALASSGQRSQGTLTANSEREVMAMLDDRGLFPVTIAPAKVTGGGIRWNRKIRSRYMCGFYSQLADLLHSGVPLMRSLEILERQGAQPVLAETVRDVRAKVADGTSLADAMNLHPRVFNELAVSMVRAGQEGGFLEDVLKRVADFTEHQEDLKGKVVGALAYPVFLAVVGFIVLNILVVFFVPRFEPIFKKLEEKGELPVLTSELMLINQALQRQGIFVVAVVVAILWAVR